MTTMEQSRAWQGWPLFSLGFRPFFLFGAIQAALMVAIWVPWYLGLILLPSLFPPVAWHVHELMFGYVPAIVAGFLLTAVPNWTGRLPVVGWPLLGLFALWLMGRIVIALSQFVPEPLVYLGGLAFAVALVLLFGREIIAGRAWRNLKVVVVLALFAGAQALFYYESSRFGFVTYADRAAIALIIMLIQIIGGRVVPSFTHNWLKKQGAGTLPAGFSRFDLFVMAASGFGLALWVLLPMLETAEPAIGVGLLMVGGLNIIRQARWHPLPTWREPMVAILHLGFLAVGAGFLLAGYAAVSGDWGASTAAVHCWTIGAIGTMTLAMMTRASRGHTGSALTAPPSTIAIYALIILAIVARIASALQAGPSDVLLPIAGIAWVLAFAGFAVFYGPMLIARRRE